MHSESPVYHVLCLRVDLWTMGSQRGKLDIRFLRIPPTSFPQCGPTHSLWTVFTDTESFLSEPGPMNDHCPFPNLFANRETSLTFARHSVVLSFVPQEMSLNIDINMILPVKLSGVSSGLNSKRLTSSLSCNVLNPGKIFHSNSIGSPSILSKFLYFEEDFNHPNHCSHASFDWWFSKILP